MSLTQSNALKGIAIVMMIFHHCFYSASTVEGLNVSFAPFSESQVIFACGALKVCVSLFVFVTGYGIAKKLGSAESSLPFDGAVLKRVAKMMVPFYVVYVVSFVLCFLLSPFFDPGRPPSEVYGEFRPAAVLYVLADFLGLSYAFGTPMLNETWWYMSVAIALVFLTPLLCWSMKRFGPTTILGAMFFVSLCLDPAAAGMLGKMGWYSFTLATGCWCAMTGLFERIDAHLGAPGKRVAFAAAAVALFCVIAVARAATGSRFYWLAEAAMAVSAASFVVALGGLNVQPAKAGGFSRHPLYGYISYSHLLPKVLPHRFRVLGALFRAHRIVVAGH